MKEDGKVITSDALVYKRGGKKGTSGVIVHGTSELDRVMKKLISERDLSTPFAAVVKEFQPRKGSSRI